MSPRIRSRLIAAGLGLAAVAGGVAVFGTVAPAGAAESSCVARAVVPARMVLTSHAVIRPRLAGTPGCHASGNVDYGGTAILRGPGGRSTEQRWTHFGDREQVDLYRGLDRPGTYTISDGDAQVYDAGEVRVASSWQTTSVVVKYGSRMTVRTKHGRVRATLSHDTADGRHRSAGATVSMQRRTGSGWHTVATKRTTRGGIVTFARKPGKYRLVASATGSVWGAVANVR